MAFKNKLIASIDTVDNGRYDTLLTENIMTSSGLGTFPWYINMQIEVDDTSLKIYYLNRKQHEVVIPSAFLRFENTINDAYLHVGWGDYKNN